MSLIRDCIVSLGLTIFPTSQLSHPTLSHCYALIWKVCKISLFLLICRVILGHLVLWNKLDSIFLNLLSFSLDLIKIYGTPPHLHLLWAVIEAMDKVRAPQERCNKIYDWTPQIIHFFCLVLKHIMKLVWVSVGHDLSPLPQWVSSEITCYEAFRPTWSSSEFTEYIFRSVIKLESLVV